MTFTHEKHGAPQAYNVGIVGSGLMGRRRAQSLLTYPDTKLVRVADIDHGAAQKLAGAYAADATDDYRRITQAKDIDIVVVSTVNSVLAECAIDAATHGKHILVEKPVATNVEDLEHVIAAVERSGVVAKAGYNHRFMPHVERAKQLCDQGVIGRLEFIEATYGHSGRLGYEREWRAKKSMAGGGELLDQGSHIIDLCEYFLGPIAGQRGTARTLHWPIDVDDNAFFTLESAAGAIAQVHVSSAMWPNRFEFKIQGDRGRIDIEGVRGHYGRPKLTLHVRNEQRTLERGVYEHDIIPEEFPDEDISFREEMGNFLAAIRGTAPLIGDVYSCKQSLLIINDIYRQNGIRHEK